MSMFDKKNRMPPTILTVDPGNNNLQLRIHYPTQKGVKTREILMPHGYMTLNDSAWQKAVQAASLSRARQKATQTFRLYGDDTEIAVTIGHGAMQSADNSPRYGNAKYQFGGIDALIVALLCEAFPIKDYPKGHNNIVLAFGFPPSEWQQTDSIGRLIAKNHRIEQPNPSGGKSIRRQFHIRSATPYDEVVGGVIHAAGSTDTNGRQRNRKGHFLQQMTVGDRWLVLDAGGWLGSMGWVEIVEGEDGNPFPAIRYDSFRGIDGGAITVRQALREALKTHYPNDLRHMRLVDMDDKWLDRILIERQLTIKGGQSIDATNAIQDSLSYVKNTLDQLYRTQFASGIQADRILLTGGTVQPLYEYIFEMLGHDNVTTASKLNEIVWANVRGGDEIHIDALLSQGELPNAYMEALNA